MFATGLVGRESWPGTLVNEAPFPKKKQCYITKTMFKIHTITLHYELPCFWKR